LQNVIERAVILARDGRLVLEVDRSSRDPAPANLQTPDPPRDTPSEAEWRRRERANILAALDTARWKIYGAGGAAEMLGLKPTTLASRMKAMGIKRSQ
jgi:transcriptional regulator with GAF, ATPase, and Fis domain